MRLAPAQFQAPTRAETLCGALDIRERLAAAEPGNADWQRDLAVSCYKMASFHGDSGNATEARAWFARCRDVLRGMRDRGMHLDPHSARVLEQLERQFGD